MWDDRSNASLSYGGTWADSAGVAGAAGGAAATVANIWMGGANCCTMLLSMSQFGDCVWTMVDVLERLRS